MPRLRIVAVICLAVLGVLASLLAPSAIATAHNATAQPAKLTLAVNDPGNYADHELIAALRDAGELERWLATSPVSVAAALLEVEGGSTYTQARGDLIDGVSQLVERAETLELRANRLAAAMEHSATLATLAQTFVEDALVATDGTEPRSLRIDLVRTRAELELTAPMRATGFSLDAIALIDYQLEWARREFVRELTALATTDGNSTELASARARLSGVINEIETINESIDEQVVENTSEWATYNDDLEALDAQMTNVHNLRVLAPTFVGGLPLVTLDAYVQGATHAPAGCEVEWSLLAGIGRIESRHGTMHDSSVQASGRLSTSIFGPLLDGGATEAEARAAIQAAEDEAAAVLAAEAAEAERIDQEREEHFNSLVWGEEPEEGNGSDAGERGGTVESDSEDDAVAEASIFDPELWGEQANNGDNELDNESDGDDADGEDDEEDEDAVLTGNGFAVIIDTDNGSLDGNARWDRAVGPMQFIPETWSYWETDGNNDGWADPQNLYDAAASAARFLCKLQQTRGSSPYTFVLGYNSSQTYVNNVMAVAETFEAISLPSLSGNQ